MQVQLKLHLASYNAYIMINRADNKVNTKKEAHRLKK